MKIIQALFLLIVLFGCTDLGYHSQDQKLFNLLPSDSTGIVFKNDLTFEEEFNIYKYRNFYNGGGVALGDINNDGLIDVYFTANQTKNRLFLNKGNFKFADITISSKTEGSKPWSTGVSMVDINNDGWLDIYVCNSGDINGDDKQNELFINNGDLTFSEKAEEFGIADKGFSTHSAFFDFDKDGDLDMYLLNNSYQAIGSFNLRKNQRPIRDSVGGDKFFENVDGKFIDVSEKVGIYGSIIGFGLGVTVSDVNKDGWQDIFISNDFFEHDYLYINNGDGTFSEESKKQMRSMSSASMGAFAADLNNDAFPEIFVTDMLPESNDRLKSKTSFKTWDKYIFELSNGYHHQFMRNALHLNNKNGTFSEISRYSGVYATDWSWGALAFDMNNDGRKDLFVANGIKQDLTDQDYIQFASNEENVKSILHDGKVNYKKLVEAIPSGKIKNYAFLNQNSLKFTNLTDSLGLNDVSFSNGAAFGDLDNDGDLDLIVNNLGMESFVYRNNCERLSDNSYLKFNLKGNRANVSAIGAQITVYNGDDLFYYENIPAAGFQSSMDPNPLIGLGNISIVDSVVVLWPLGNRTVLKNVKTNQVLALNEIEAEPFDLNVSKGFNQYLTERNNTGVEFVHEEDLYVDFDKNRLLNFMRSNEGPPIEVGDINGDKRDDVVFGGAYGQSSVVYTQIKDGTFIKSEQPNLDQHSLYEDLDILLFDADSDDDLDLLIVSGGARVTDNMKNSRVRFYKNEKGVFIPYPNAFPNQFRVNSTTIASADIDADGDIDLFIGGRLNSDLFGDIPKSFLLLNDGNAEFTIVEEDIWSDQSSDLGMVKSAEFGDLDNDGDLDLVLAGEWMPIKTFDNQLSLGKGFVDITDRKGFSNTNGWWNKVLLKDLDLDGNLDIIAGNWGTNTILKASPNKPLVMYINDFDKNDTYEQILCTYFGDTLYPIVSKSELVMQIPSLKKKYLKYNDFKNQTPNEIFGETLLNESMKLEVFEMRSCIFYNTTSGFDKYVLPEDVQYSPVFGITAKDVNNDGYLDLITGGNFYLSKPRFGKQDASYGNILINQRNRLFESIPASVTNFTLNGEVRNMHEIIIKGSSDIIIGINNSSPLFLTTYKNE